MQNMQGIRAIDSLDEATSIIKNEMESMFDGFIAIGFYLKKIRDDRLYLQKGYSSIFDYSDQAFKLTRFQTTRFMEVNDVYSIGGYSPEIDDKWKGYGSSKLVEMMALPEEIREMVPQQATVREIRDAKKVVRETKDKYSPQMNLCDAAQEPDENWMKLLAKMLGKDRSIFMTMIEWERSDIGNDRTGIEKEVQTLVNPSGFQVLRFETANIWMTENCIRVNPYKVNGEVPNSVEYTYIDLAMAFEEIYYPNYPDISEAAQKIYERVYGEALWQAEENDMCDVAHESEEQIPGQMNVEDYPEILPEQSDNDINNDEDNVVDAEYREVIEENTVDTDEPEKIKPAQPDLPVLKNNDQRKEWLKDYKSWGLWYRDENIDVNYYKYDFSDGSRLIVDEYPQRRMYWNYKEFTDEHYYHLIEKNRKYYGSDKTFEQQYVHSTDSETYLVEFLKNLQKKETKKHV